MTDKSFLREYVVMNERCCDVPELLSISTNQLTATLSHQDNSSTIFTLSHQGSTRITKRISSYPNKPIRVPSGCLTMLRNPKESLELRNLWSDASVQSNANYFHIQNHNPFVVHNKVKHLKWFFPRLVFTFYNGTSFKTLFKFRLIKTYW